MKPLLILLLTILLPISACNKYANALPLKQVQEKFINDSVNLNDFLYLGKLHCIGHYFHNEINADKDELLHYQHNVSFNNLKGIARLFDFDKLAQNFYNFEKEKLPKSSTDIVSFCHQLYENNGKTLYQGFINNPDNYIATQYKKGDDDFEHYKSDMTDYLQYGQIDARRYSESCQTYNCK